MTGRFLPDKAIDLIDEAASRLRIEIDSLPLEIDEVERRIVQLQIERQALLKEKDKAAVERREALEADIAEQRERANAMKAQWQAEKGAIGGIQYRLELPAEIVWLHVVLAACLWLVLLWATAEAGTI